MGGSWLWVPFFGFIFQFEICYIFHSKFQPKLKCAQFLIRGGIEYETYLKNADPPLSDQFETFLNLRTY